MAPITQKSLAKLLGVSRSLVSMALSDSPLVAEVTKSRIKALAAEHGYVPDVSATSLRTGRSTVFGILLPNLRNPLFEDVAIAVQRAAAAEGLLEIIATGASDWAREKLVIDRLQALRILGLLVVSPTAPFGKLRDYAKRLPIVSIGTVGVGGAVDTVHTDEDQAAALILDRAIALGARQLAHLALSWPGDEGAVVTRKAAIERATVGTGLEFRTLNSIAAAVKFATAAVPGSTMISVHNDLTAVNLLPALRAVGLTPGEDIWVSSYDDTALASTSDPNLTSISQDSERLGNAAVELLLDRTANMSRPSREIVTHPTLTIRASG
jgi:DNA-binding LacI/PurR family transcriptional regulator